MLEACALSDKGCVRSNNEDYCLIEPALGLYVLADGMGGARAGERASRLAVETVAETVFLAQRRDSQVLLSAVEAANQKVLEAAQSDESLEGMGTTLVAALESGDTLAIASVGDSRAYILEDGKLRAITVDQSWVQEVGRPLGLDEVSLKSHPMRHVLTMAIGVGAAVRIRYYAIALKPGTLIMLSSDGLHGVVGEEEIEGILSDSEGLEEKCRELISAAHAAGSPDNVTVLLIRPV